ncbi:MAG: NAD(P)-dependent oxidoreductase [Alphaproteobacteria bacterium]|nr:NAD(P)-dependent oxidoreductase [Alphaproteobacteria bacterium]
MAKVGYIGLGRMGAPMAMHLARAGHEVAVYNRTRATAEAFVKAHGGRVAATPAEAAKGAAFVAACVKLEADSAAVIQGADGAFAAMGKGAVFVDHTTTSAAHAERLAATASGRGFAYLDAPVAGAEEGAKAGRLTVMIGGAEAAVEQARPFLAVYSKAIERIGPAGHGQLTKMLNQILIVAQMQSLAEAVVLGRESGLDVGRAFKLLSQGSAQSWWMDNRGARMVSGELDPRDGGVANMIKDLGICLDEARRHAVSLPITALISQFFAAVKLRGRVDFESPSLLTLWDRRYF